MSETDRTFAGPPSENRENLERIISRALSLTLPPHSAASLVRDALREADTDDETEVCRAIAPAAIWQHRWLRLKHLISRSSGEGSAQPPLGHQAPVSSAGAVALALHLGVNLDRDQLSDVLATPADTLARRIFETRLRLIDAARLCSHPPVTLLGFYNGETFDLAERMHLRDHLRDCHSCSALVSRFELLDDSLRAQMADSGDESVLESPHRLSKLINPGRLAPVALIALALVIFLALGGLLIGVDRVLGGPSTPVPLVPEFEENGLHGWLVSSTVDGIAALNLATGERRTLVQPAIDSAQPPVIMMSPSGDTVALWSFHEDHRITTSVDIVTIGGDTLQSWRWDRSSSPGQISSWLNDDELLFVHVAGQDPEESAEDYIDRISRSNELLALNVHTGQRRTLYTGSIAAAVPSPDRKFMALLGTYNRFTAELPGRTLEIRPMIDGLLGDAVAVEEERYPLQNSRPIWSQDSTAVYFTRLTDDSVGTQADAYRDERSDVVMVSIDGEREIISENPERERIRLLGVSPDRDVVLYLKSNPGPGEVTWDLYRVWTASGETETLASSIAYPFFFSASATWLPDGETAIVNDSRTHFLHAGSSTRSITAGATRFLSIGEDRPVEAIATELGLWGVDAWGEPTLRWFPDDWLESRVASQQRSTIGLFSEPEVAEEPGNVRHTSPYSSVSPGGRYALFEHASTGVPVIWSTTSTSGRLLAGTPPPADIAWAPGNSALVGVQNDSENGDEIALFASRSTRVADFFDNRGGDPAGLNGDLDRDYAMPAFSTDGNLLSYFVVDDQRRHVELWMSGFSSAHRRVLGWNVPENALIDPPLVMVWTSRASMLVAVPDKWRDGYPTETRIVQIEVDLDGAEQFETTTIHRFRVRGGERATTLESLNFSPDGDLVAFKQRAYYSRDPEREQQDSIVVASTADVNQSITIARGEPGSGLTWSPAGDWISFGLDDRIMVSRADGTDLRALSSAEDTGRYPLWLPDGRLYYTEGGEDEPRMMLVTTR